MPISNGANSWPRQYFNKPTGTRPTSRYSTEPKVVFVDRPYDSRPQTPRAPSPQPKVVYINRTRSPTPVNYVTRPSTPPPPPRQVTIVKQSPPPIQVSPAQVTVVRRTPTPVQTVVVSRSPSPTYIKRPASPIHKVTVVKRPQSPVITYVQQQLPPPIHDQVTYIQNRRSSPPPPHHVTYINPPPPPVTYVTRRPVSPIHQPRTVYVERQPEVVQHVMPPPPPELRYDYGRAMHEYSRDPYYRNYPYEQYEYVPSAYGREQGRCSVM
jgi:hypothetical protein